MWDECKIKLLDKNCIDHETKMSLRVKENLLKFCRYIVNSNYDLSYVYKVLDEFNDFSKLYY